MPELARGGAATDSLTQKPDIGQIIEIRCRIQWLVFSESRENILHYDLESANIFGQTRGKLLKRGIVVARLDLMIAAIALQHNFTLVTHDIKDFGVFWEWSVVPRQAESLTYEGRRTL